jgi:hypothetical protein
MTAAEYYSGGKQAEWKLLVNMGDMNPTEVA